MNAAIRHEPEAQRFVADDTAGAAIISYHELPNGTLDFTHTFVPVALRGRGLASRLAAHALDYARAHRRKVVPSCPFVATFVARHPEYRDLLA